MSTRAIPLRSISLDAADAVVDAALRAATEAGLPAAVAVVDATGALRAFRRADGAPFLTADIAVDKAWTAASSGRHTHVWNEYMTDPKVGPLANVPRMTPVAGGYAIFDDGQLVGGVGISGGTAQQDEDLCRAALVAAGFAVDR